MSVPMYSSQMFLLLGIYCSCPCKYVLVEVTLFSVFENADIPEVTEKDYHKSIFHSLAMMQKHTCLLQWVVGRETRKDFTI